jgi:hypothetical protein
MTSNLPDEWPFADAKNAAVFTTREVVQGSPVLLVCHDDDDGSWQFIGPSGASMDTAMLVSLHEVTIIHPDIMQLADLPYGWRAQRATSGEPWMLEKMTE